MNNAFQGLDMRVIVVHVLVFVAVIYFLCLYGKAKNKCRKLLKELNIPIKERFLLMEYNPYAAITFSYKGRDFSWINGVFRIRTERPLGAFANYEIRNNQGFTDFRVRGKFLEQAIDRDDQTYVPDCKFDNQSLIGLLDSMFTAVEEYERRDVLKPPQFLWKFERGKRVDYYRFDFHDILFYVFFTGLIIYILFFSWK